ncbi:MAG TPA: pitrilysin family protein [Gemmatimonadaceae bacterium]|nr:pitrilysin family protein [Gemmatimonadaceae bacterium]
MISLPLIPHDSVVRTVLPNGLTVLLRRDVSAPVVAIVTYVKAGYFDESDDVVGIAHVLEHMYFKGTGRRGVGEISRETKALGGYINAGTIYDHTSYYTVVPSSGFERALDIQADAYANSVIDATELARELEVIIQEAKRKRDNPSAVSIETLYSLLYDRHRMRRWRIGTEDELRSLTRDDVMSFYRALYRPRSTILSIVGDLDPDAALRAVESHYGSLTALPVERSPGPEEPEHTGFRYRELSGDITQTQLAFGWRTQGTLNADTAPLELAAAVLGSGRASRLYRAVRERELAASVSAYNYTPTELGVFVMRADGPPSTTRDAARAIWDQLRTVREEGVGKDELWRVRRLLEARWIRQLETMEGQANYLAEWEALGDWTLGDRFLERLLTVSPTTVTATVERYLGAERGAALVYRPTNSPPIAREAGELLELLDRSPRPVPLPATPPFEARTPSAVDHAPELERVTAGVHVYRTALGLPILVHPKPSGGASLVHVGVYVLGGATAESEQHAGLTMLMTRTALKGTERRSAECIAEEAELLGGAISASAGSESFGWGISVPSGYTAAALELIGDVSQRATIPEEALDTERTIALAGLEQLRDDMQRYPMRLLTRAAFPDHPYGIPSNGFESSLASIDATRVREWHRQRVLDSHAVVVIVGDVDPREAAAAAARHFRSIRPAERAAVPVPVWPDRPVLSYESREKAQTALAMAFPSPDRRDPDRFAAQLLSRIASGLGGRFFEELRDRRSLAYTVSAYPVERSLAGMFVSYIATSPEREDEARQGLLAEFAKLRDAPVSDDELARAREYAIGTHAIRQQSGAAVLGDILDAWLFGTSLEELTEHDSRIRSVTARDIQSLAQRYFDESRLVEGVVRGR